MRASLPLLILILAGCRGGSPETDLVGTWKAGGGTITLSQDKKYASTLGGTTVQGSWTAKGSTVTLVPEMIGGRPVGETVALHKQHIGGLPPGMKKQAASLADDLGATRVLTLSEDGKTLSANEGTWTGMTATKG